MAVIADIELRAGFQVRVRWYAQATQRYPANENEYYSTFFTSLEPNSNFELSDPRFDINAINDDAGNLQYIIRDVCYTETLVPQFVDFIYINPDYITSTVLSSRVDGGANIIHVDANPDINFSDTTLAAGNKIQIGPIQSDVYTIEGVYSDAAGTTADVNGRYIRLTTQTTKTFAAGLIVALSDTVSGTYPDSTATTALARILDNTGSLNTGTIQVTTPLYFDLEETVRRFYYDASLQTPFNGARGSGDTTNLTVIDPRDITREIEAGWWAAGDMDNEAAEEACLIDSQGFLIAKRDRAHAYTQVLYYAERETDACTTQDEGFYLSNHPDFTDTGFTSIRNDNAGLTLPQEGFYAWSTPTIIFTNTLVSIFWGDNQYRPGYNVLADDEDSIFFPDTGLGIAGDIWIDAQIDGEAISFQLTDAIRDQNGSTIPGITDVWAIDRATITNPSSNLVGDGALNGLAELITYPSSSPRRFAVNRFVRYWNGTEFDAGRVHPTLLIDNCPSQLSDSINIMHYSTQQDAACNSNPFQDAAGNTVHTVYYLTVSGSDFVAGNVTAIFTDPFGNNSDTPSALGVRYIRLNDVVYFWNGNSLSIENDPCTSKYCSDPSALNFGTGTIPDNSLCVYPQTICDDPGALNYTPPSNRNDGDIIDNGICQYPVPDTYFVGTDLVSSGATPAAAYNINVSGGNLNYLTTDSYNVTVTVTLNPGWEGSIPTVSFIPPGIESGGPLANGESVTVSYVIGNATATEIPPEMVDPAVYTGNYSTDQNVICDGGGDSVTLYYDPTVGFGVGTALHQNQTFLSSGIGVSAFDGWYTDSPTFRVAGGSIAEIGVSCPVEPMIEFTVPSNVAINPDFTSPTNPRATSDSGFLSLLVSSVNNPSNLELRYQWILVSGQSSFQTSSGSSTDIDFRLQANPGTGGDIAHVIVTVSYIDPNDGAQISIDTRDFYVISSLL